MLDKKDAKSETTPHRHKQLSENYYRKVYEHNKMLNKRQGAAISMRRMQSNISAVKRDQTEIVDKPNDDAPIESMRENFSSGRKI